jgi:hypothetical protein
MFLYEYSLSIYKKVQYTFMKSFKQKASSKVFYASLRNVNKKPLAIESNENHVLNWTQIVTNYLQYLPRFLRMQSDSSRNVASIHARVSDFLLE